MSESFEINIKTLSDTKAVKALQEALNKISSVLASFISVSKKSTSATKEQSEQFEILSGSIDENTQAHKENQEQQEKSKQSQDDNTKSSKSQSSQFKETRTQVDLLSSAFQGMGISLGMLATNGLAKIPSLIKNSLGEYAEQEVAQVRLQSVLESTNQAYDGNLEKLKNLASQMEILTNADGKQVLAMESVAVAMGVSAEQMEEVIKGAVGLSKAYNMDLSLATKASSAAIQGKTDLLTRYIPMLSELATEEERLAEVQKSQAIGYQAAIDEMQTFQGSMTALGHSVGALSEVFGEAFAPRVQAIANALSSLSRTLEAHKGIVIGATKVISTFIALLVAKKVFSFASEISGLSLAFRKVSMACALTGKSINVFTKSLAAAKVAMTGLTVAFKAFLRTTVVLAAISLAFEGICWAVDKLSISSDNASLSQKKLQAELKKTSQANINALQAEQAQIEKTGLSEEDYAIRLQIANDEIKHTYWKLVEAKKKGFDQRPLLEEIKVLHEFKKELEASKRTCIALYDEINSKKLADSKLQAEQAYQKYLYSNFSVEEKYSALKKEETQLHSVLNNAKKEMLSTDGDIALKASEVFEISLERLAVVNKEKALIESNNKLEAEKLASTRQSLTAQLAILKAKAEGNDVEVARLERIASLENLKKQYKSQGIKSDSEALALAKEKLALEEQITNAQIAQSQAKAKEEFLAEYKIKKARANGDETLARSLELQKQANDLANRLGIEYDEALNALRNLEKAEEDRNNKNKKNEKTVEYDEKDVERAKKIVERGAKGSTGQKVVDQAQSIVDGREIQGQEYAMFSGAKERSKTVAGNDSQIDNKAYANAQKLGAGVQGQNAITQAQTTQQAQPQIQDVQSQAIAPQAQPQVQASQAQDSTQQTTQQNAPADASSTSADSRNAEIVKGLKELASGLKEISKKIDKSNEILKNNQSTLEDILSTDRAEFQ